MCGIAGTYAYRGGEPVSESQLIAVRDAMTVRGPDGGGLWLDEKRQVGLAHRRLAIIDLSPQGNQPMHSPDGRYSMTFNGEIYNYNTLRDELLAQGVTFVSHSDSEVILTLYAREGAKMISKLRGMFALAIWDRDEQTLFAARDPFGIKPFYFADDGKAFRFASQVKALLAGGDIDTRPNPAGIVGYYIWGHVPSPHTIYRGVLELPAGHWMKVDANGAHAPKRFFSLAQHMCDAMDEPVKDRAEHLFAALDDTVRHHLVADVPVSAFLSAGFDSTTILSAMRPHVTEPPFTLTMAFRQFQGTDWDESPVAEEVARLYDTRHETRWIETGEFRGDLGDVLKNMDQPSIDGVNTYLVSKYAKEAGVRVALSGLGGDEIFGGYPSFQQVPKATRQLKIPSAIPGAGRAFRAVAGPVLRRKTSPKYAGLLEYGGSMGGVYLLRRSHFMPFELFDFLDADLVRQGWDDLRTVAQLDDIAGAAKTDHGRMALLESQWYMRNQLLRDSDWAGMAHSIEIRVPFVDTEFWRRLAPLVFGSQPPTKREFAKALKNPLPDSVFNRPKTGFSVPVREWLMEDDPSLSDRSVRGFARVVGRAFGIGKV